MSDPQARVHDECGCVWELIEPERPHPNFWRMRLACDEHYEERIIHMACTRDDYACSRKGTALYGRASTAHG
jgi:hypothetical protein